MNRRIKVLAGKRWAGALLLCTLLMFSTATLAQDQTHRELYDNPELYDCLSEAARNMLSAQFGCKSEPGQEDAVDGTGGNAIIGTGGEITKILLKGGSVHSILSALINTLVNNPAADATARDTQSETTIVLGSGSNLIAGFNDSGSFIGGASKFTGYSRSTDGGNTWTDGGTLPTNPNGDAGDPVLARDNGLGRTYFSTLQFSGNGLRVFRSDDDGATWMAPTQGVPGATGFQDKEWIAVDNFPGAGQGNVYLAYRDFASGGGIRFTRSTDNGATFTPSPRGLLIKAGSPANVQGAFVVVGIDHAVYVFWYDQNFTPRQIRMRKSTDQGVTFGPEVSVTTLTSLVTNGGLSIPAGFRSNSFPQVVVNPVSGNLYVVYNDPSAVTGGDRGNIFFRQSTDGGATWSAAVKLNDDAGTNVQFFPAIAVKPDGSGLSVTWYDQRRDPANRLIERWGVIATISGSTVTFGPNFRISPPFPPAFGQDPVVNSVYMGDYDQMAADNSFFYTVWGDNRLGNAFHANQPDVRFAAIPMAGPGAIVDFIAPAGISGGNGNGVIEFNECNDLTLAAQNNGTTTASGVTGTITTTTPGVVIAQGTSSYPDLAPGASGTNTTPFTIATSPSFVCGTNIILTLTLSYAGGSDVSTVALPTCQCPPTTVTGSIAAGDPTTAGRPFRDDPPSSCAVSPPCAVFNPAGTYRYDSYTFTNGSAPACVTVTVSTPCTGINFIQAAAYLGTFNPSSLCSNFLGDIGASPTGSKSFSFNVPASATIVVVVHESFVGGGCPSYTATVSGLICATDGGNQPPTISVSLDPNSLWSPDHSLQDITATVTVSDDCPGTSYVLTSITSNEPDNGLGDGDTENDIQEADIGTPDLNFKLRAERSGIGSGRVYTVTYTATDAAGHTASASATVTVPLNQSKETATNDIVSIPERFDLAQNIPNPFNPTTIITYGLPIETHVRLEVYNLYGQRVTRLVDERKPAGYHEVVFDASKVASGMYFYRLSTVDADGKPLVMMKKMLVVK